MVPIAHQLHQQGLNIMFCAHGAALSLLQLECPYAEFVEDVPFEISYAQHDARNGLKLLVQLPNMFLQVYREHQLLKQIVSKHKIDCIISDNRYGFYHAHIPNVFITHQLHIQVPFAKGIVNWINHYFIKKFNSCWVPDWADDNKAVAGILSRNNGLSNIHYIGLLSRATAVENKMERNAPVLYLLSGPEPQRTKLEQLILQRHAQQPHQAILIRGTTKALEKITPQNNLIVYDMCSVSQLQSLIAACKYVVCRSGYSTIMDLIQWQKNAVLIPTPGQYEQEYLASYAAQKKWFYTINQQQFLNWDDTQLQYFQCPANEGSKIEYYQLIEKML